MQKITITKPDDMHLHLRDGRAMQSIVLDSARQFARAIVMPNLKPPVTDTSMALAYRGRIMNCLPENSGFEPLMTLYLTDNTTPGMIRDAYESRMIFAVKYYPAGTTTNSENGVTSIEKCFPALECMQELGMPLLLHGEVNDADIFDRERVFIDTILKPLLQRFPGLKTVLEHITTEEAAHFVRQGGSNLAATITPQHLLLNRNALLSGGIHPHHYCLPVLKAERHRQAIIAAATSGEPCFFLGTDSAPHARHDKESACGCAGIYTAHNAMSLYAEVFESEGCLDRLEAFACFHGADFYGLPRNKETVTLEKSGWTVPQSLPFADTEVVPFRAGEKCHWQVK